MSRYDHYEPKSGGFRAVLHADTARNDSGNPVGYGLNANGRAVPGSGNGGIKGVVVLTEAKKAGDVIDIMTDGQILECVSLAAGTTYYADATTGVLTATAVGNVKVGTTTEADRLIVRIER